MNARYWGALMIVLSCGSCGFKIAMQKQQESIMLRQMMRLIDNLTSELEYQLTPLPEVILHNCFGLKECLKKIMTAFSQEMQNQRLPDAACCMDKVLMEYTSLPGSVLRMLKLLGESLGRFDLNGQLRSLAGLKNTLEHELRILEDNQQIQLKCYRVLGICAGAALAILLL